MYTCRQLQRHAHHIRVCHEGQKLSKEADLAGIVVVVVISIVVISIIVIIVFNFY